MHGSSEPDLRNWKSHRARCTHLQTQPGQIQPIDSSQLGGDMGKICLWMGESGRPGLPCRRIGVTLRIDIGTVPVHFFMSL
ncbi:hypothetical protein L564_3154 [Bordetella pertussis CHLA-15]|nr:hypothetical protein L564_3154 [Bordetella pertussis CHLA-15]